MMKLATMLAENHRPLLILCLLLPLAACGSSDGISGASSVAVQDGGGTTGFGGIDVPAELISNEDGSATVQAALAGLDLSSRLIDTSFSCYDHDTLDYGAPTTTLAVAGTRFNSTLGNGQIDYVDPEDGDLTLRGGPFGDEETLHVRMDQFGQSFEVDVEGREHSCFQHGASLERAFHRFMLNTPELGDYTCQDVASGDRHFVRLAAGGDYVTALGSGTYTYAGIIEGSGAKLEFEGGPLAGESIRYRESPTTGRQAFRISSTEAFGLGVGASSSLSYVCVKFGTPRPFKQYGYAAALPVAAPSVPINGLYFSADFRISFNHSHSHVDYYHFRNDGYLLRDPPGLIGDDCDRTAPSGLNYCQSYTVVDGRLKGYNRLGRETFSRSVTFGSGNVPATIDGEPVELVRPSSSTYLSGVWSNNEFSSVGCVTFDFCSHTYRERVIRLEADGRFIYGYSSDSGNTLVTAIGGSSAFSTSSSDSRGVYEIRGNHMLLWYDDGDFESPFFYYSQDEVFALGAYAYTAGEI